MLPPPKEITFGTDGSMTQGFAVDTLQPLSGVLLTDNGHDFHVLTWQYPSTYFLEIAVGSLTGYDSRLPGQLNQMTIG